MQEVMKAKVAAEHIGCSYWMILEMAKAGKIPHFRVGKRVLFRRQSLDQWMQEQEAAAMSPPPAPANGRIRRLEA